MSNAAGQRDAALENTEACEVQLCCGQSDRHWRAMCGLVVLVALVFTLFNLRGYKTFGSHEVYAAVPARGMLDSGDWVVPRIGGQPRLRKPPLAYWVVAGSAMMFGGLDEWTARLPAAVSALGLCLLIGIWGTRWYGRTAGVLAALVQATAVHAVVFSRKAEVDMLLCLCTTGAMFLIAQQPAAEDRGSARKRWLGVYVLLSVAWMAKFYFGAAMVLVPCVAFLLLENRYRDLRHMVNPLGWLVLAASIVVWPCLLLRQSPAAWEVWRAQTLGRVVGELGSRPFWYYAPHLLSLTLPWTVFVICAIPQSWKRAWKQRNPQERFLWIWLFCDLAIMSVSAGKHQHYLNVCLPMFSLITGAWLAQIVARTRQESTLLEKRWRLLWWALSLGGLVATATGFCAKYPWLQTPIIVLCGLLAVGCATLLWLAAHNRRWPMGIVLLLLLVTSCLGLCGWILPGCDHRAVAKVFAQHVRNELLGAREVCAFQMDLTAVEFYVREPVKRIETIEALRRYVATRPQADVIAFQTMKSQFESFADVRSLHTMPAGDGGAAARHPPLVLFELRAHPGGNRPRASMAHRRQPKRS